MFNCRLWGVWEAYNIVIMLSQNFSDEQRDLYFKVIRQLPDEVCNFKDDDIMELHIAINDGSIIKPSLFKRIRNNYIYTRLLKEIQQWNGNQKKPEDEEIKTLLNLVSTIIAKY